MVRHTRARNCESRASRPYTLTKSSLPAVSVVAYVAAIALAFVDQWISDALYIMVAMMWLVPDQRIEAKLDH